MKRIGEYVASEPGDLEKAIARQTEIQKTGQKRLLGALLVEEGVITEDQLQMAVSKQRLDRLRFCNVFRGLSIEELMMIQDFATEVTFAAGEDFIIRHEDRVPGVINVAGIQSPGLTAAPAIALLFVDILKKNGLPLVRKLIFHGHREKTIHLFAIPPTKTKRLIEKDASYGDIVCRCEMVSAKEVR